MPDWLQAIIAGFGCYLSFIIGFATARYKCTSQHEQPKRARYEEEEFHW